MDFLGLFVLSHFLFLGVYTLLNQQLKEALHLNLISCLCSPGQSSMMPSLTAEVLVPRLVIPALCGEDGGCLDRIREVCIQPVFYALCPTDSLTSVLDLLLVICAVF